jgi:predicted nuclease of predicted toxin-antitoxin system
MRFVANENFPVASVRVLRQAGHDVLHAAENLAGLEDEIVLQRAHDEQRILITFDRDYGELIFKRRLATPLGIVYLRFDPATPVEPAELVLALQGHGGIKLEHQFTVLTRDQIRQRPLP